MTMMMVALEQSHCNYKVNTCRFKNEIINRSEVHAKKSRHIVWPPTRRSRIYLFPLFHTSLGEVMEAELFYLTPRMISQTAEVPDLMSRQCQELIWLYEISNWKVSQTFTCLRFKLTSSEPLAETNEGWFSVRSVLVSDSRDSGGIRPNCSVTMQRR